MNKVAKLLLVEDSPDDVVLTKEALIDAGIKNELFVVRDGEEAINYCRKAGRDSNYPIPDLVLLDLNLPKRTGHEVLVEMKMQPNFVDVPVVLLTVSQNEEDIARALKGGMNYYMRKPVEAERLQSVLQAIGSDCLENENFKSNCSVFFVIAGNPQTPGRILEKLAHHANEAVRKRVAENFRVAPCLLEELAGDESSEVRAGVSTNPAAGPDILWKLCDDQCADVRFALAERCDIPAEILEHLSHDENPYVAARASESKLQYL